MFFKKAWTYKSIINIIMRFVVLNVNYCKKQIDDNNIVSTYTNMVITKYVYAYFLTAKTDL